MPTLALTTTDGTELRFELTDEVHTLGRLGENDLHVPDASVSSRHAELHRQNDGNYELVDLQSTNGTKVNGEAIERVVLSGGENLLFGQVQAAYAGESGGTSSAAEADLGAVDAAAGGGAAMPDTSLQAEITNSSSRPQDFDSSSPFGAKKSKKDPFASLAMAAGIVALVACAGAALLVLQMTT